MCCLPILLQQCSDAIKRAQILKEKMGLPKTVSTPAAQMLLSAGQQTHAQMSGTASAQESHATEGSLERQSSWPSQPPVSGPVIGKAVSMPAGSGSMLRAYAAGTLQSPVEEGQELEPSSTQRHVLGATAVCAWSSAQYAALTDSIYLLFNIAVAF